MRMTVNKNKIMKIFILLFEDIQMVKLLDEVRILQITFTTSKTNNSEYQFSKWKLWQIKYFLFLNPMTNKNHHASSLTSTNHSSLMQMLVLLMDCFVRILETRYSPSKIV